MEEQNPWWRNEEDDEYEEWKRAKIRWVPNIINQFTIKPFSLHFLVGPRQIGKTTSLKIFIQELLKKGRNPKSIFYYSCDELSDYKELGEIIDNYIFARREWGIKSSIIILDEITFVDEWYRAMKSRIDRKVFRNDVLIVTGSASIEILKGKERFPGRRGYGRDIYFLPIDFNNFSRIFGKMELKDCSLDFKKLEGVIKANRVFKERLFRLFKMYLECGGFPLSIIDMFTKNKITFRTIRTYLDWLKNDWRRAGKNEKYMKEVISYILKARASPISWFNIAKETSINSPHTVQSYVETLENLFCVKVLNMISPDFKILYRKNKKIHIADPFIYRVLSYYTRCEVLEENIVESVTASHFSRIGEVFFWRNKSEVDMIFLKNKTQIGVEVKWGLKKWRKPKHLKKTILLDKNNLPVFLSSVRWIDKNF